MLINAATRKAAVKRYAKRSRVLVTVKEIFTNKKENPMIDAYPSAAAYALTSDFLLILFSPLMCSVSFYYNII